MATNQSGFQQKRKLMIEQNNSDEEINSKYL